MNGSGRSKGRANEIDRQVGEAVRRRRLICGVSQRLLGDALNVRLQQVQKYEAGTNRMSPARLHDAASLFGVSVADFFDQIELPADRPQATRTLSNLLLSFTVIKNPEIQRALTALTRAIAAMEKPT